LKEIPCTSNVNCVCSLSLSINSDLFLCSAALKKNSPNAFSFNAVICDTQTPLHYSTHEHMGGIIEYMVANYTKKFRPDIYAVSNPNENLATVNDWSNIREVRTVKCVALAPLLSRASISHIDFFILDAKVCVLVKY
jgi:hypothetical protein